MTPVPLSPATRELLIAARQEAETSGAAAVGAEHILLSLSRSDPAVPAALARAGLDPQLVEERLGAGGGTRRARPAASAEAAGEAIALTSHARRLLESGARLAHEGGAAELAPAHLLVAALAEPRGALARVVGSTGAAADAAAVVATSLGVTAPAAAPVRSEPRSEVRSDPPEPATPAAPAPTAGTDSPPPRERRRGQRPASAGDGGAPPLDEAPTPRPEPSRDRPQRVAGTKGEGRGRRQRDESPPTSERPRPTRAREPEPDETPAAALEPRRPLPHLERAAARRRFGVSWKYLLLAAVPVSIVLSFLHADPVLVFGAACLGILPLAGLMGEATEQLAHRTGPTVGGLLNATFGNAAELIIALVALRAGQVELVKASITGSILGNLLLILGLSLMAASMHKPEVRFNRTAAGMSAAMMALAVVGLVFPALFHAAHPAGALRTELWLSEAVAAILILTYGASLLFSLRTHRRLFGGEPHPLEGPVWSVGRAVTVLAVATAFVAWESEILVHAVGAVTASLGLSPVFLGLIIIPIIGNAAEHAAAVLLARKGQTDVALQIALGSSTQIALLVAPILVFAGILFGQETMNLVFTPFEVMALGLSTIVVAIITLDGESHWFEGLQLLAVYAMVAVAAFFI